MQLHLPRYALLLAGLVPASGAHAAATTFQSRRLHVAGSGNVQATGVDDSGSIAASVYSGPSFTQSAVILKGGTVTTLPMPDPSFGAFTPTAINHKGDVVGWARRSSDGVPNLFLYQNGAFLPAYDFPVAAISNNVKYLIPNPIGVNDRLQVFFTYVIGLSDPTVPQYGIPPKFHDIPQVNRFTTVESINKSGTVAGFGYSLSGPRSVFVGKGKAYQAVTPPGSTSVMGGFVNDAGAVAGSYLDAKNAGHGFVFQSGAYASFDMPEAATSIAVTAIGKTGRVAGTYASVASGKTMGFLYNGTTVSSFGGYDASDTVTIALNDRGVLVVCVQIPSGNPDYQSYRVSCSGSSC